MFGKKSLPLHTVKRDGLSQAAEAFRRDAEPGGDVMLFQPPVQVRFALDEITIALFSQRTLL
jgi:hypothetical protein